MTLVESVLAGKKLALARLLTRIENDSPEGRAALSELFPHTGRAHLIGITGAPGTGKSTLVNHLAYHYRHPPQGQTPRRVAVVAVDPSSPFTGGAVLGDRVRMRDLAGDPGVFIRSMATRGSLGGLANATAGIVQAFDAAGFEIIFIETVGAGQAEVDIASLAHTTLVLDVPGLGDEIQAIKAGILEIADILVINKADRPGVDNTERALRNMLELARPIRRVIRHHEFDETIPFPVGQKEADTTLWIPPILRTIATEGTGIDILAEQIDLHRENLLKSGDWELRERTRLQSELETLLQSTLVARWRTTLPKYRYKQALDQLISRSISPRQAVDDLLNGDHIK